MEYWKRNKKYAVGFLFFLLFMLAGTILSKGIYTSRLPRIKTGNPKKMSINHDVEIQGSVKQGKELAVYTQEGIRIKSINVRPGDMVEEGTVLFELDTQLAKTKAEEIRLNIEKLKLDIIEGEMKQATGILKQQVGEGRAREDYDIALENQEDALEQAEKDLERAESKLQTHRDNKPKVKLGKNEDEEDIPEIQEWLEKKEALKEEVDKAQKAYDTAVKEQEDTVLKSKRAIENAQEPAELDFVLQKNRLELTSLENSLVSYQKIINNKGVIKSTQAGYIIGVDITAGQLTTAEPCLLYADMSSPLVFEAALTKEQKKYVNQGDNAVLKLGNHGKTDVEIHYIGEKKEASEDYQVSVLLEEGVGVIGQGGTLTVENSSESYELCIPLEALHEENQQYYIYTAEEKSSILGMELAVQRLSVVVLDKNDRYAAIENAVLDQNSEYILYADKEIKNGDIVRYQE